MKKTTGIAAFIAASAIVLPLQAAELKNFYGSANVGLTQSRDHSITYELNDLRAVVDFEADKGYVLEGALGYDTGPVRIEAELSWRDADIDKVEISEASGTVLGIDLSTFVGASADVDANISSLSGMINAWYDIDTGSRFTPFVGGGVGVARVSAELKSVSALGQTVLFDEDESDTVFAWQVGAGLGYKVSDNTTIQARYKYFAT